MRVINEKAQKYYVRYRQSQDSDTFTDLYNALSAVRHWFRRKVGELHDANTIFDDSLLYLVQKDGITDITRLLYRHLMYRRLDLWQKNKSRSERFYFTEEESMFGATFDREETSGSAFIYELVERSGSTAGADIVSQVLATDGSVSISAIAARMGMHHYAALRSLKRLGRYYDADIDGQLSEYLA